MKTQLIILVFVVLPGLIHAQNKAKCRDTVEIPKALYDAFKNAKESLENINLEIIKDRGMLEDIQKRYLGCEEFQNVIAMRKEAEEALKAAEAKQKPSSDAFEQVDKQVRKIISDAQKKPVACEFLDRWSGPWGQIVTVLFTIDNDQVLTKAFYSPLSDPRSPSFSFH